MDKDADDQFDGEDGEGSLTAAVSKSVSVVEAVDAVPGYNEFELDIEKVLRADLPACFDNLRAAPLTESNVVLLPEKTKGAYMLFLNNEAVYAGKTDTRHGFRDRLLRHHNTIQHRKNLDPDAITFKAVRILVFSNFDAEAILIAETRRIAKKALPWNDTGFGSNDPGHNREGQETAIFDREHPIDIDREVSPSPLAKGPHNLLDALIKVKNALPYTLRYATDLDAQGKPVHWRKGHDDQRKTTIVMPNEPFNTRAFLSLALEALPERWVATRFPDRVILYKEPTAWPYGLERILVEK